MNMPNWCCVSCKKQVQTTNLFQTETGLSSSPPSLTVAHMSSAFIKRLTLSALCLPIPSVLSPLLPLFPAVLGHPSTCLSASRPPHAPARVTKVGHAPQEDDGEDDPITPARHVLHGIPSVAHQRLTRVSMPAYSSPLMPYLLMDEDDVVVLPRRRTLARLSDELDDDPVLKWYEDRIHHAEAEASAIAQSRINELCTPRPRHLSITPMYTPKIYPEPVGPRLNKYSKYRPPITEDMKPIRRNIEMKSRFSGAQNAAQNTYRRMGSGHLACMSLRGGPIVSKRVHSRFYNGERARSEVDMASRLLPPPRDDANSHRRSNSADREYKPAREPEPTAAPTLNTQSNGEAQEEKSEE